MFLIDPEVGTLNRLIVLCLTTSFKNHHNELSRSKDYPAPGNNSAHIVA